MITGLSPEVVQTCKAIETALQPVHLRNQELAMGYLGVVAWLGVGTKGIPVGLLDTKDPSAASNLAFNHRAIRGHYIDLHATVVGDAICRKRSYAAVSKMHSEQHTVWNEYFSVQNVQKRRLSGVVQFAYDRMNRSATPLPRSVRPTTKEVIRLTEAVQDLLQCVPEKELFNELQLDVPVTPNAYVMVWDARDSRNQVTANYPLFRKQYNDFIRSITPAVQASGGRFVSNNGDGQNIVIDLPLSVDRNDPRSVARFGAMTVVPLIDHVNDIRTVFRARYDAVMALGVGLGYVETLTENAEVTGPVFWDISSRLEAAIADPFAVIYTDEARYGLTMTED